MKNKKSLQKVAPLEPSFVKEAKEKNKELDCYSKKIENRIHYIIMKLYNVFNVKNYYWKSINANEGEQGDMFEAISNQFGNYLNIEHGIGRFTSRVSLGDCLIIDKNGKMLAPLDQYQDSDADIFGIPIRWLYEDFEQELVDGKAAYDAKLQAEEDAIKNKDNEKKKIIKSVKKKLSKEEREALGI